jgi:pimeloyl-ACP methyl ester carboxylesterase
MPMISANGFDLHVEDTGSGMPIVMSHSFLCSGDMWASQVAALSPHYRVINIDLPGHGRSAHVTAPLTVNDMGDQILAVLDHLGIERAVWAGLSIGGMIALPTALRHPERVSGLILLDSHAGAESLYKKFKYGAMSVIAGLVGVRPLLPSIVPLMFGATARRDNPALVAEWRGRFAELHVPSVLKVLDALVKRPSVVPRLSEITAPALVMVGDEDTTLPLPDAQEIADGLPNATLVRIPNAGHLSTLEQPDFVNAEMLKFLEGLKAQAAAQ